MTPPLPRATSNERLLVAAAEAADWPHVLALVRAGGEPRARDGEGATLLHLAILQSRFDVAQALLALADRSDLPPAAQLTDRFGRTPLHYWAEVAAGASTAASPTPGAAPDSAAGVSPSASETDLVEALLRHGAEVNARDQRGRTPLHAAALRGCAPVVARLIAAGAAVNAAKADGQTPLHFAVTRSHRAVIELLLRHGADPHRAAADGQTPDGLARALGREPLPG